MSSIRRYSLRCKSCLPLLLASIALTACDNSVEPAQPKVIHFSAVSPTDISGVVATEVASVPVVRVTDGKGKPVAGFDVTFKTQDGGVTGKTTVATDNSGVASAGSWKLGNKAGNQVLKAFYNAVPQLNQLPLGDTAVFTANAQPGPVAAMKTVDGGDQFGLTGGSLPMPLRVSARDAFDNPIPGLSVVFSVATGTGSIAGATTVTASNGEATSGIWTLGPEAGTQSVRAATGNQQVTFKATACSADACRLLFNRNGNIYVWNAGTVHQVTTCGCADVARWSPDGKRIAFIRTTAEFGVYVVDADGSNLTRIAPGGFVDLTWSPDAKTLALASSQGYIAVQNLTVYSETPLRLADGASPDWSPDGKKIVFVAGASALRVMNADGSGVVQILPPDVSADITVWAVRWSPDGTRIAFTKCDDDACDVYVIRTDGSELKRLTNDPFPGSASWSPAWSPDGTGIAYTRHFFASNQWNTSIFFISAAGGNPSVLINSASSADWLR